MSLIDTKQKVKKVLIKIKFCSESALFTPWKINGWNLQITHLERKMIFQSSRELCSMLIFRGVMAGKKWLWIGFFLFRRRIFDGKIIPVQWTCRSSSNA